MHSLNLGGPKLLALQFHDRRPTLVTMRWKSGPVQRRHVPEPERLREKASDLKGKADKLLREADALLAEAEALDAANAREQN